MADGRQEKINYKTRIYRFPGIGIGTSYLANPHDVLGEHTLGSPADLQRENLQLPRFSRYTASDSLTTVMDRIRNVRARNVLNKLAVSQEEGLTNAQLMLTNHDLKPGP